MCKENVPKDANIISRMFVITIKNIETENPTFKARYVLMVIEIEKRTNLFISPQLRDKAQ